MRDLVEVFSDPRNNRRLHRVGVLNHKKEIVNVISQSDVIGFAYKHIDSIPSELGKSTVKEMQLRQALISVRIDTPFIDTLETLFRNRISGLALVDDEYRLCGNLSASDLRVRKKEKERKRKRKRKRERERRKNN